MQTHLLHLSTNGAIAPHVDNVDASGSIIMGVSLGSPRVLRMVRRASRPVSGVEGRHASPHSSETELGSDEESTGKVSTATAFEVLLSPGSVYIQR